MKKLTSGILSVLLLFLLTNCNTDDLAFDKLSSEVNFSPEMVFPIAKAKISVWDLIESANDEDTVFSQGDDGIIKIEYRESDIYTYEVRDLVTLPSNQGFTSDPEDLGEVELDEVEVERDIDLHEITDKMDGTIDEIIDKDGQVSYFPGFIYDGPGVDFDVENLGDFTDAILTSGNLTVTVENRLDVTLTAGGEFYDTRSNETIAEFSFSNIDPNRTSTTDIDLSGKRLSDVVVFKMTSFETVQSSTPVLIDLNDFFKVTLTFSNLVVSGGTFLIPAQDISGFEGTFDFDFEDEKTKAFESGLTSGNLQVRTMNNSQLNGTLELVFPNILVSGSPLSVSVGLNNQQEDADISGAVIDFTSDADISYNRISYNYIVHVAKSNGMVNYNSTDQISVEVNAYNLDFEYITGDFGQRTIEITNDKFDLGVDFLDKIQGDFNLADPQLEMVIHNSIGLPANVNANFQAFNSGGDSEYLNPEEFAIPVPDNMNQGIVSQSIYFNKSNSNIVDFFALPPSQEITYEGEIEFNPDGPVDIAQPNFFRLDATLGIDFIIDLPFNMNINDLVFSDTVAVEGGDLDQLSSADLIVNAINGIPLSVDLQIAFIDTLSGNQYGITERQTLLAAASVANSGQITPTESSNTFEMTEADFDALKMSNGIVVSGIISSPDNGTTSAEIKADSEIEVSVTVKAKLNL